MAPETIEAEGREASMRNRLSVELKENMVFQESGNDCLAYKSLALAVESFMQRGFSAADAAEKELERQVALPEGDPKKMPSEEVERYEDMITQVETWAVTLPYLLQQARVIQTDPVVQGRMWNAFEMIHGRQEFLDELEQMRFIALKGSNRNTFSPLEKSVPPELYKLASIATVTWMLREQLQLHPDLKDPRRRAERQTYLDAMLKLSDTEVEGSWTADRNEPVDAFILSKIGDRFARPNDPRGGRGEALVDFFRQGRVKINGTVIDDPKSRVKPGDIISIITVFDRKTEQVGLTLNQARLEIDDKRRAENAERVTQGLPGAESFAFNARLALDAWTGLLVDSGPKERKRYVRQFRGEVMDFQENFLNKKALEDFRTQAVAEKEKMIADNTKAEGWIKWFCALAGEPVSDEVARRLTTSPEEFNAIFTRVMKRMEADFETIASNENKQLTADILLYLRRIETKETLTEDEKEHGRELLRKFGAMRAEIGRTLATIQTWQVRENVQRVGGTGPANNLEQVTRVDGKSFMQHLRHLTPYEAFQTYSYRDENGRIIIVDPGASFSERGIAGHAWEAGKLGLETAALSVVLSHLLTRIPYLARIPGFQTLAGRVAVPVLLAESQLALAKEMARHERIRIAGDQIKEAIEALQALQTDTTRRTLDQKIVLARSLAKKIHSELTVLLHAASRMEPTDRRPDLLLEGHMYTNQLVTAFGFPPVNQLDEGMMPKTEDELRVRLKEGGYDENTPLSPEVVRFIEAKSTDETLLRSDGIRRVRGQWNDLRESIEGEQSEDWHSQIARGMIPTTFARDLSGKQRLKKEMEQVRSSKEFEGGGYVRASETLGKNEAARIRESYVIAGEVFDIVRKFESIERALTKRSGKRPRRSDIPMTERFDIGGGKKASFVEVELQMQRLMGKYTMTEVLAASKNIAANPPSNANIAEHWLKDDGYTGSGYQNQYLDSLFGTTRTRGGNLSEKVLVQWIDLYSSFEQSGMTAANDATKEVNLGRMKFVGSKLYDLPGDYWMVIKQEVVDGKYTEDFLVEIGLNSGRGDGRSSPRGSFVLHGTEYAFSDRDRYHRIDGRSLRPGTAITFKEEDGHVMAKDVPVIAEIVK